MRVWIGCLACYSAGNLVGDWYEASEAGDITTSALHESAGVKLPGLASPDAFRWSPDDGPIEGVDDEHEELSVFDHEDFYGVLTGECSPAEAQRIADLLVTIEDDRREALGMYLAHMGEGISAETVESFGDSYIGAFDKETDYAMAYVEEMQIVAMPPPWPLSVDWEHTALELFCGDFWCERGKDGMVHVFQSM